MLNRERNRIMAEVFLAVEENNNGKDCHKKDHEKEGARQKTSASRVRNAGSTMPNLK